MEINFRVSGKIAKPVAQVFEAVVDPAKLSAYFTTGQAEGRIEQGATVIWRWHESDHEALVKVIEVVPNAKIVLEWKAHEGETGEIGAKMRDAGYMNTVTFLFSPTDDGRTLVEIVEEGWEQTPGALRGSYLNCEGWTGMLMAMKAWLEYGINLRDGPHKQEG